VHAEKIKHVERKGQHRLPFEYTLQKIITCFKVFTK